MYVISLTMMADKHHFVTSTIPEHRYASALTQILQYGILFLVARVESP